MKKSADAELIQIFDGIKHAIDAGHLDPNAAGQLKEKMRHTLMEFLADQRSVTMATRKSFRYVLAQMATTQPEVPQAKPEAGLPTKPPVVVPPVQVQAPVAPAVTAPTEEQKVSASYKALIVKRAQAKSK